MITALYRFPLLSLSDLGVLIGDLVAVATILRVVFFAGAVIWI